MKITEQTTEQIRDQILDAAMERFGRYGWGKTTMAEIAKDCEMSAGNLYRYYENKKEIGAGCAERCMKSSEALWRDVLNKPGLTAADRLREAIVAKVGNLYKEFSERPPLFELVIFVSKERRDLVTRHEAAQQSLIAEILAEGNRTGEFDVPDVLKTAKSILGATFKFIAPHYMGSLAHISLEDLEHEARQVVDLLVRGLAKR